MLTMKAGSNIILGLDKINLEHLMKGEPIVVPSKRTGMEGAIIIVYGETLQQIIDEMKKSGFKFPSIN